MTAPTILNTYSNAQGSNVSSLGQAMTNAVTAGSTIIVFTNWYDVTAVPAAVNPMIDTSGNSYTLLASNQQPNSSPNATINVWIATNAKAASAGANTVTAAWNTTATSPSIIVLEISKSSLDNATLLAASSGASTSDPTSTGPVTTKYANELFLLYCWTEGSITASGAGWTALLSNSPDANSNGGEYISNTGAAGTSVTGHIVQNGATFWTQVMLGLFVPPPNQPLDPVFFGMI